MSLRVLEAPLYALATIAILCSTSYLGGRPESVGPRFESKLPVLLVAKSGLNGVESSQTPLSFDNGLAAFRVNKIRCIITSINSGLDGAERTSERNYCGP